MRVLAILGVVPAALASGAPAHTITVDGDATDWIGTPPLAVHDAVVSAGEWIYRGEIGDVRGDPPLDSIEHNCDITEVRLTADAANLYVLVRVRDVTVITEPCVAIGIEFTNNPLDTDCTFLGDESGVGFPSANLYPEYNVVIHNPTAPTTEVELYHDNGGGTWYAPPSGWDAYINPSTGAELIEARVPLADINLPANPNFRVSLATFDNDNNGSGGVGYNNACDATQDYPTCDALDLMGGTVGVSQNAWDRGLSSGAVSQAFSVSLGTIPVELSLLSAN